MKTYSIITGKVRNESRARLVIEELIGMRERGNIDSIIFSTWIGELNNYPRLIEYFVKNNIDVIESTEQKWSIQESHQKIPILSALSFIDDDAYITRHRFDRVFPDSTFESHLNKIKNFGAEKTKPPNTVFDAKITVNTALLDVPFFINDLVFSGVRRDILKICDMSVSSQLLFHPSVSPEFTFFACPLIKHYAEISQYISTFPGLAYSNQQRWEALKSVQKTSPLYAQFFALYVFLVSKYFNIGYGAVKGEIANEIIDLDKLLFTMDSATSNPDLFFFNLAGHFASTNNAVFDSIYCRNTFKSQFSEMVAAYIIHYEKSPTAENKFTFPSLSKGAVAYLQELQKHGLLTFSASGLRTKEGPITKVSIGQILGMAFADARRNSQAVDMGRWSTFTT